MVKVVLLCCELSFAFGQTYNHNITINPTGTFNNFSWGEAMGKALAAESQAQAEAARMRAEAERQAAMIQQENARLQQQAHLERLKTDPEYALRSRLNEKHRALDNVLDQAIEKYKAPRERIKIVNEEFVLINNDNQTSYNKAKPIIERLMVLDSKAKSLVDNPKILPQEKAEVKDYLSNELHIKRDLISKGLKALEDDEQQLKKSSARRDALLEMDEKYFTEADKYTHKIAYDNKAYEAYLNILEKRAELWRKLAREQEAYFYAGEKYVEKFKNFSQEMRKIDKEIMKSKSFVKKYEKLFGQIEKRLGV